MVKIDFSKFEWEIIDALLEDNIHKDKCVICHILERMRKKIKKKV